MSAHDADNSLESPTLARVGEADRGGYEIKFLIDEPLARRAQHWAMTSGEMSADPHADPSGEGAYRITTLYLDTPTLAVYHRTGEFARDKFRLRRYGESDHIFLERKHKKGDRVNKERSIIPLGEVGLLANRLTLAAWSGQWFHELVQRHALSPAARLAYERIALVGRADGSAIRMTFDRHIRGVSTDQWGLAPVIGGVQILSDRVVMELKFAGAMPAVFKRLMAELGLSPTGVSKYRTCRDAWSAAAGGGAGGNGRTVEHA